MELKITWVGLATTSVGLRHTQKTGWRGFACFRLIDFLTNCASPLLVCIVSECDTTDPTISTWRRVLCLSLQGCCFLVSVLPTGSLRVSLFVTEMYQWSFFFGPSMSQLLRFVLMLYADHLLCTHALAKASSKGAVCNPHAWKKAWLLATIGLGGNQGCRRRAPGPELHFPHRWWWAPSKLHCLGNECVKHCRRLHGRDASGQRQH